MGDDLEVAKRRMGRWLGIGGHDAGPEIPARNPDSPETRELKKQTRMMAERDAWLAGGGGFLIGILVWLGLAVMMPDLAANGIAMLAIPFTLAVVGYRYEYRRLTSD